MKIKKLVIDTAAFLRNVPLWEYADEFYTVPEVIAEIKDRQTKHLINSLPIELKFLTPSADSLKFIIDFIKKTGDYASLSIADIKVLALTYELEVQAKGGNEHLRQEPLECRTEINTHKPSSETTKQLNIEGFYLPKKENETKEHNTSTSLENGCSNIVEVLLDDLALDEIHNDDLAIKEVIQGDKNMESEDSYDEIENSEDLEDCYDEIKNSEDVENYYDENEDSGDDDDDDSWITPSNLKNIKNRLSPDDSHEEILTACITADYAIQNTLKHIGLKVIGVDGKIIHNLRTFILRCYACFKTTDKMDLLFCKNCGNKTLKKVAVTSNPDGTQKIWISTKKAINIRGTKFSLPRPRGGKHAINPILVADQREAQQRATKLARMRNDPLNDNYVTGISPFVQRDIYSRSAQLGITTGKKQHRGLFYWEQRNPNVAMKKKSGRKK